MPGMTQDTTETAKRSNDSFLATADGKKLLDLTERIGQEMKRLQDMYAVDLADDQTRLLARDTQADEIKKRITVLLNQRHTLHQKQQEYTANALRERQQRETLQIGAMFRTIAQAVPGSVRGVSGNDKSQEKKLALSLKAHQTYYQTAANDAYLASTRVPDTRFDSKPAIAALIGNMNPGPYRAMTAQMMLDLQRAAKDREELENARAKVIRLTKNGGSQALLDEAQAEVRRLTELVDGNPAKPDEVRTAMLGYLEKYLSDSAVESCILKSTDESAKTKEAIHIWPRLRALDTGIDFPALISELQQLGVKLTTEEVEKYEKNYRFMTETLRECREVMDAAMNPLPQVLDYDRLSWLSEDELNALIPDGTASGMWAAAKESIKGIREEREAQFAPFEGAKFYADPDCRQPLTREEVNEKLRGREMIFASKQLGTGTYTLVKKERGPEKVFTINDEQTVVRDLNVTREPIRLGEGETPEQRLADVRNDYANRQKPGEDATFTLEEDFETVVLPVMVKNGAGTPYALDDICFGLKERTVPEVTEKVGWFSQKMFDWFGHKTSSYTRYEEQVRARERAQSYNTALRSGREMIREYAENYEIDLGDEESYRKRKEEEKQINAPSAAVAEINNRGAERTKYITNQFMKDAHTPLLTMTDEEKESRIAAYDETLKRERRAGHQVPEGLTGREVFDRLCDLQNAGLMRAQSTERQHRQDYRDHHITEEEFRSLPETDTANWKRQKDGTYEDRLWLSKKNDIRAMEENQILQESFDGLLGGRGTAKKKASETAVRSTRSVRRGQMEISDMNHSVAKEKSHQEALNAVYNRRKAAVAEMKTDAYKRLSDPALTAEDAADAVLTIMAAADACDPEGLKENKNELKGLDACASFAMPGAGGQTWFESIGSAMRALVRPDDGEILPESAEVERAILRELRAWDEQIKHVSPADRKPREAGDYVREQKQRAQTLLADPDIGSGDAAEAVVSLMACATATDVVSFELTKQTLMQKPAYTAYSTPIPEENGKTMFQLIAREANPEARFAEAIREQQLPDEPEKKEPAPKAADPNEIASMRQAAYDVIDKKDASPDETAEAMMTLMCCVDAEKREDVEANRQRLTNMPAFKGYMQPLPDAHGKSLFQIKAPLLSYCSLLDKGARRPAIVNAEKELLKGFIRKNEEILKKEEELRKRARNNPVSDVILNNDRQLEEDPVVRSDP